MPPEGLLWLVRVVLLAAVVLHVWSAWALMRMSGRRGRGYERRDAVAMSYASRTMRWGGVILLFRPEPPIWRPTRRSQLT